MKTQKTKNEVILDLLERKDEIVDEKIDCLREYQEWVMNAPYKIITLITISMILEKVIGFLPKEKWWGNLIYKILLIFFLFVVLFCSIWILGTFFATAQKSRTLTTKFTALTKKLEKYWLN